MSAEQIAFIAISIITLGAALLAMIWRNVFHVALLLSLSFAGIAGLQMLLQAPFSAAFQFALIIVTLLSIKRWRKVLEGQPTGNTEQWWIAVAITVSLCALLCWVTLNYQGKAAELTSESSQVVLAAPVLLVSAAALLLVAFISVTALTKGE